MTTDPGEYLAAVEERARWARRLTAGAQRNRDSAPFT